MKLSNLTVAQLALALARIGVLQPTEVRLKSVVLDALNDLAWSVNWKTAESVALNVSAEGVLDVFKACRESEQAKTQELVAAVVLVGDLGGRFLYEPQLGRLTYLSNVQLYEPQLARDGARYKVYFCHPEGEEVMVAQDNPYEYLDIPETLYELSSATAGMK